jgi:hypothetical protein
MIGQVRQHRANALVFGLSMPQHKVCSVIKDLVRSCPGLLS